MENIKSNNEYYIKNIERIREYTKKNKIKINNYYKDWYRKNKYDLIRRRAFKKNLNKIVDKSKKEDNKIKVKIPKPQFIKESNKDFYDKFEDRKLDFESSFKFD